MRCDLITKHGIDYIIFHISSSLVCTIHSVHCLISIYSELTIMYTSSLLYINRLHTAVQNSKKNQKKLTQDIIRN